MSRRWLGVTPGVILTAAFVLRLVEAGSRANFGLFFHPLNREFGWDRGTVSLAMSIGMVVWALGLPVAGKLCDRYGPRRVMAVGFSLMVLAFLGSSTASQLWHLYLWWGVVGGMGWGLGGTVPVVALMARWFTRRRGLAMSVPIAGVSAGAMVVVPLGAALFTILDWRGVFLALGLLILGVCLPLILMVRDSPPSPAFPQGGGTPPPPPKEPGVSLSAALGSGPYRWQMTIYFACGFVAMALPVHLLPYAMDMGISELGAARALSLFSAMAVVGVIPFGALSDRLGRKNLLALGYVIRLLGLLLLLKVRSEGVLLAAAALFGLGYSVPGGLIPALVADIYGRWSVGLLMGVLSLMHQVAGALGVWYAGYLFDLTGSYFIPFLTMIGLTALSATASYLIRERKGPALSIAPQAPGSWR